MDVREKLVELLNEVQETGVNEIPAGFGCTREYVNNEKVASHLIANGVTVQECKVGDTIYEVDGEHGIVKHEVYEVCVVFKTTATDDKGNEWDDYWTSEDIGNAFKTRNEAEATLPQPPKGE